MGIHIKLGQDSTIKQPINNLLIYLFEVKNLTDSKKWKSKLLSSGFPLEFQVAKILVSKGFSVNGDYTYSREDNGIVKDFSVDIEAIAYAPFTNPNKVSTDLSLLIECKYRDSRNTNWLFLPEINKPDYSRIILGHFMRIFDNFSEYQITKTPSLEEFANQCEYAYKATEIKFGSEPSVYDSEIKHGLSQLQYALPYSIKNHIYLTGLSPNEDNVPFIICPILVTTSKLIVLNKSIGIHEIENANSFESLGKEVPYLIIYQDYGPDFEKHSLNIFKEFEELYTHSGLQELEKIRENSNFENHEFLYPTNICKGLATGERFFLNTYFTQFLVCNLDALPQLIDKIKEIVLNITRNKKPYTSN